MRENRKSAIYRHAMFLNLLVTDPKEWRTKEDRLATKEEVAACMKEAEVYVKATQQALTEYAAPWMDKPYGALDKETEGLLLRGWGQEFVRLRTGMALQEMMFHQQYMSERQWNARIKAEKEKLLLEWAGQDKAYLAEQARLRATRAATASK